MFEFVFRKLEQRFFIKSVLELITFHGGEKKT